jgi:two-component system sensor histidine kinase ChiS
VYNSHRANFLYPPIRIGIGLHTGPVMLGIIGHSNFMQGTVISDAVNLSARLESLTKRYRVSLIVSEQVIKAMGARAPSHCRYLDTIKVEGKDIPVSIYEIFEADPEFLIRLKLRTRSLFEKGVRLFVANRPAEALDVFNQVWRTGRGDYTVAYYIMRSSYYVKYGIKREKKIGQL